MLLHNDLDCSSIPNEHDVLSSYCHWIICLCRGVFCFCNSFFSALTLEIVNCVFLAAVMNSIHKMTKRKSIQIAHSRFDCSMAIKDEIFVLFEDVRAIDIRKDFIPLDDGISEFLVLAAFLLAFTGYYGIN